MLLIIALVLTYLTTTPHEVAASVFVSEPDYIGISDYSIAKNGLKTGECVQGRPFNINGHWWVTEFYPNGFSQAYKEYVSIMVNLLDPRESETEVKAMFTHRLFDWKNKSWSHNTPATTRVETFSVNYPGAKGWGFYDFMKRSTLEASNYLGEGNDTLVIRTTLWVLEGNRTITSFIDAPFHNNLPHARPFKKRAYA